MVDCSHFKIGKVAISEKPFDFDEIWTTHAL